MKINTKLLITLAVLLLVLFSLSSVSAEDNQNITSVSYESDSVDISDSIDEPDTLQSQEDNNLASSESEQLSAGNNVVTVKVFDSYNETNKNWDQDGVAVSGATVEIIDSSNNTVKTVKTNSKGTAVFNNLDSGKYTVKVSYSTYESMTKEIDFSKGNLITTNFLFVPDILLLVSYNDHNEKVDLLMNMSKRVAFISTTDVDKSREWLFLCLRHYNFRR